MIFCCVFHCSKMCWYFSFEVTESCFEQTVSYNRENGSSKESCKSCSLLNLMGWLPWFCNGWYGLVKTNKVFVPLTLFGDYTQAQWVLQEGEGLSVLAV